MKKVINEVFVQMYIDATKEQIAQVEKMLGPELPELRSYLKDTGNATRLRKYLNETLTEGDSEAFQAVMSHSDEARLITDELHEKVLQLRNLLFPELLS